MNPQSPFRFMQVIMLMAGVYFVFSGVSSVMKGGLTTPGALLLLIAAGFFGLFAFDYHLEKKKIAAKEAAEGSEFAEGSDAVASPEDPQA
ncbi:hypothetical protein [Schaalia sp. Marseille-Q2122]|uniref:hypothetical protein n=1 Tax=Schaalia sp. Marseille-Q2122 TaxID=2736604 RepID=UPI00158F02EF|nr:hypothetical protein [Schaalia sp. Marseille-Q2122]